MSPNTDKYTDSLFRPKYRSEILGILGVPHPKPHAPMLGPPHHLVCNYGHHFRSIVTHLKNPPLNTAGTTFRDGSFQSDIPMQELRAQFHVHHFITSQVNPYLPFFIQDPTKLVSVLQSAQSFLSQRLRHRLNLYVALGALPTKVPSHVMAQQQFQLWACRKTSL